MARYFGEVGYADTAEASPGNWIPIVVERTYRGDVIQALRRLQEGDKVNDDISLTNTISIVADAYANEHIFAIRYIRWQGGLWKVSSVEVQAPRLLLRLGGVYNGDTPATTVSP